MLLATVLISCSEYHYGSEIPDNKSVSFGLDSLRKRGTIIAVTDINSKNYFIYKGEPMGFHYELLKSFSDYIGVDIEIVAGNDPDHSLEMLKSGEADLLAMDLTVSSLERKDILFTEQVEDTGTGWGIRSNNSDELLRGLNEWISLVKKSGSYSKLYARYFINSHSPAVKRRDINAFSTGRVSEYDDMIKEYSDSIHWDWRLLASLICQESHFDPDVTSYAGAYGLMQIMPGTGKNFGIDITSSPENNIKAGAMYINWLHSIFDPKISDEKERLNFILASYNAGPGHVLDAMKLAEKNGMDPLIWNGNVSFWLLKKYDPKYYNDIVVKNGYFKGTESVKFVSQVLDRFEHYKAIIPEEKPRPF